MKGFLLINMLMLSELMYAAKSSTGNKLPTTPRPTSWQRLQSLEETRSLSPMSQHEAKVLEWWKAQDTTDFKSVAKTRHPKISAAQNNQQLRQETNGTRGTQSKHMGSPYTRVWRDPRSKAKA